MKCVTFHALAERELADAAGHYDSESPGLGSRFLAEARRCASVILEYPNSGATLVGQVRRHLLRGFPYGLLYSVKADGVRILAVMHLRRRPSYWVERE